MKYESNQYSDGFSICSLIIAGMFLWWGFNNLLEAIFNWWWWFGFLWIAIGLSIISSQIYKLTSRSKLRNVVLAEFQGNPEASVEHVSRSTGISRKDIQAIVLDLKASGELRAKFNSETGQVKHLVPKETEPTPGEPSKFCSNCGTPITKESAQYCAYCGGKI